jgi:hypothetical protein
MNFSQSSCCFLRSHQKPAGSVPIAADLTVTQQEATTWRCGQRRQATHIHDGRNRPSSLPDGRGSLPVRNLRATTGSLVTSLTQPAPLTRPLLICNIPVRTLRTVSQFCTVCPNQGIDLARVSYGTGYYPG